MNEIRIDQNGKIITYVRYEPIYENDVKKLINNIGVISKNLIFSHVKSMNVESFLNKIYSFEKENEYDYSNIKKSKKIKGSERKTIYLSSIEMLLPKAVQSKSDKVKLVAAYIRNILAGMKMVYLNYFAYEYVKGKQHTLK